jgi:hypothetical protein
MPFMFIFGRVRSSGSFALLTIVAFAVLNALLWAVAIPYDRAPDEVDHFKEVVVIAEKGRLPILGTDLKVYRWTGGELRIPYACPRQGV